MANFTNLPSFQLGLGGIAKPAKLRCTAPISLAASGAGTFPIDLTANQNDNANFIGSALTMYADMGGANEDIVIAMSSGQKIQIAAGTQGYYTILQPNPISLQFTTLGAETVPYIQLINAILPAQTWLANAE